MEPCLKQGQCHNHVKETRDTLKDGAKQKSRYINLMFPDTVVASFQIQLFSELNPIHKYLWSI